MATILVIKIEDGDNFLHLNNYMNDVNLMTNQKWKCEIGDNLMVRNQKRRRRQFSPLNFLYIINDLKVVIFLSA
jgi:hypothetical protein